LRIGGPLAAFAPQVAATLEARGFKPTTVALRMRVFHQFSQWVGSNGLAVGELDRAALEGFARWRRWCYGAGSVPGSVRWMGVFVEVLAAAGAVDAARFADPVGPAVAGSTRDVVDRWAGFLLKERGLKPGTVGRHAGLGARFLDSLAGPGGMVDWGLVSREAVEAFLVEESRWRARKSVARAAAALRSLLRFAFGQGWIERDLASGVPAVAEPRLAGLPRHLEPGQVERLVAAIGRQGVGALRDRAIVVAMARMGLRCAEVAGLVFQDLDWREGTVRVSGKGGRVRLMPLPWDVGEALVDYLHVRPESRDRHVFVKLLAPVAGLTPGAVSTLVASWGRRAGMEGVGAHRLRHTAASAVLAGGGTLEEANQLLGHASMATTMIYAKTDARALTQLAAPWPGARR